MERKGKEGGERRERRGGLKERLKNILPLSDDWFVQRIRFLSTVHVSERFVEGSIWYKNSQFQIVPCVSSFSGESPKESNYLILFSFSSFLFVGVFMSISVVLA